MEKKLISDITYGGDRRVRITLVTSTEAPRNCTFLRSEWLYGTRMGSTEAPHWRCVDDEKVHKERFVKDYYGQNYAEILRKYKAFLKKSETP